VEAARHGISIFNVHTFGGAEMMRRTADAVADVSEREHLERPRIIGVTLLTSVNQKILTEVGCRKQSGPTRACARAISRRQWSGRRGCLTFGGSFSPSGQLRKKIFWLSRRVCSTLRRGSARSKTSDDPG